ncbi:hypothetical protein EBU02_00950 [bacterium]|jgi:hypothetical protein|nr:hypothetical protein [bacterium]NBS51286.1 hypothetical protein [Spartobacteria bacterium]
MIQKNIQLDLAETHPTILLNTLRAGLAKKSSRIELEIIGPGCIMADTALMLYDELMNRPPGIFLTTNARSCLLNGAVLVWLAGEHRTIRHDAWIQVDSTTQLPVLGKRRSKSSNLAQCDAPIRSSDESPSETDYRIIARYLDMYLPLEDVSDRRVFVPELHELGLIDDTESEQELAQIFSHPKTTTSPRSPRSPK